MKEKEEKREHMGGKHGSEKHGGKMGHKEHGFGAKLGKMHGKAGIEGPHHDGMHHK
jgi:hypothetical protein